MSTEATPQIPERASDWADLRNQPTAPDHLPPVSYLEQATALDNELPRLFSKFSWLVENHKMGATYANKRRRALAAASITLHALAAASPPGAPGPLPPATPPRHEPQSEE